MENLTFKEYQLLSSDTRIYPEKFKVIYPALGLSGEVGETLELVKKALRDENGEFSAERLEHLHKEIGDIIWYLAAICEDLGFDFGVVAQQNLDKLRSRKDRGVLSGSGNDR
jgi:NTP pyrophosphatase (non-canonical NTP hydrolase)